MELPSRYRRRTVQLTGSRKDCDYPHILQFYRLPPTGSISLKEFEEFAIERLQVLRAVERVGLKYMKSTNDYRDAFLAELTKQKLKGYVKKGLQNEQLTDEMYDERRKDHISHFILRLAYCRTEELRRWFINQELDLFRFRFVTETENHNSMEHFFKLNDLDYAPISDEEKNKIVSELRDSSFGLSDHKVKDIKYYKVPFLEALDLVRSRKVYLNKGYVYIPRMDLVSVVLTVFRNHLSHALAVTSRSLPQLEEDGRLLTMLNCLNQRYLGDDYSNSKREGVSGQVTPQMVDALAKSSFPLCMRTLHETLRQNHHLKHGGRMQYGLFLKGIGLSLEDALRFWREEFIKIMDTDKFDKQYSYNIRHNYGKEGKRANYTPYSCMKIILSNPPGPGDSHGCPFRHSDAKLLQQRLQSLHVTPHGIREIMDFVNNGHYQLACTRYFEITHGGATVDQAVNHPNQYFEESQKVKSNLSTKTGDKSIVNSSKLTTVKSVMYPGVIKQEMEEVENMELTQESNN